jgi:hypothetical protein
MAKNNTWREEQPRERQEEEESSREDSMDLEEAVGEVQWTKEERIARAIKGKGEFLSGEFKNPMRWPVSRSASTTRPGEEVMPLRPGPLRSGSDQLGASEKDGTPPAHPRDWTRSKG